MKRRVLRVFAGIDEAGLGPILGPLTLGYSAFRASGSTGTRTTLWDRLSDAVSVEPSKDAIRLVVADSKKVFTRNPRGHRRLEATALAFLAQRSTAVAGSIDGRALLCTPPPALRPTEEQLARHPWYAHLPEKLPLWIDADRLERHTRRLQDALGEARVTLVDAGVRAVPAAELNASFEETGNKGITLWDKSAGLIAHLWHQHAAEGLHLIVDRHGGRMRYGELISELLPQAAVRTLGERPSLSEYRVEEEAAERVMRISFAERGEERSFAVALGSCLAKYAREVCMGAFNAYFATLQEDLRPTAGYRGDGWRWMTDAEPAVRRAGVERNVLLRAR